MNKNIFNSYMTGIDTAFFKDLCTAQGEVRTFRRNDYLLQAGEIFPFWGIVESGVFKYTCYNSSEGKEYNIGFSFPGEFVADYPTCLYEMHSEINIQAATPCRVRLCHARPLRELLEQTIHQSTARIAAEQLFFQTYSRYMDLYRLTPEERYKDLLSKYPQLLQLLPLKEIASYLKITPTHMSRIRRNITWEE